jgi:ankyrin repeat protein
MDIFSAVEAGAVDMVQELIGKDQHVVNQQDAIGDTPLLRAAYKGNPEIVRMLLRAGAEVNKRDRAGRTPLYLAVNSRNPEIVRMLLDKGAEVNKQNNDGFTPLYWAACIGHTAIVRMLLYHSKQLCFQFCPRTGTELPN